MKENEDDYKIIVDNVYKTFNVYLDKANTLKEKILFLFSRNRKEKREVLKGINLKIKEGEVVALIGTNGSGKSTLLKLMTKIIYPNKGRITTRGKLTSLLELGAGFAFVGRQYHLEIGGDDYYIDLLFYHLKLKCYVVIELKTVEFQPEFARKVKFLFVCGR